MSFMATLRVSGENSPYLRNTKTPITIAAEAANPADAWQIALTLVESFTTANASRIIEGYTISEIKESDMFLVKRYAVPNDAAGKIKKSSDTRGYDLAQTASVTELRAAGRISATANAAMMGEPKNAISTTKATNKSFPGVVR
jgi:hypothetical protein